MAELLEIQHLKTYFKTGGGMLHAVDDISFTLKEGQKYAWPFDPRATISDRRPSIVQGG